MADRLSGKLLDVLIRAGLILVLAVLCYRVFAPFLTLMVWAVTLAIALYPVHQYVAAKLGGRQGWAATLITLLGIVLIVVPTAVLLGHMGDSVRDLIHDIQANTLEIPPPKAGVAEWPIVGKKLHGFWERAHADLPALIQSMQPKIGNLAREALGMVASIGGAILGFVAAFVVAGILMAFGRAGERGGRAIFNRIAGPERGREFAELSVQTIRAVAQGVLGVALIQSIVIGLILLVAHVPFAGVLALIVLVLGIAQIPAIIVILPAIAYLWMGGHHGNVEAIVYTILLGIGGTLDNVLKPLMLGRGVKAPMPVILIGALGGMAAAGILGMFVGATLLALGYQIFMGWVDANPDAGSTPA